MERARVVYKTYQESIRRSGTLQSEILQGLKAGEDIHSLFLKAVEALSLVTNDNNLYKQAEADLLEIYGVGLQHQEPLQRELDAVESRLFHLEEAVLWETGNEQKRIEKAIEAHRNRAETLRGQLNISA